MTKTVNGTISPDPTNRWSIRPPANNWAQSSAPITEQILRSYNRGKGKWFDFAGIFNDNFSYGVHDNDSLHVEITNGTTWAELNYTWVVETTAFRNMFFLTRSALEAEDKAGKKEYRVYADNPLLVKFWDMEQMRGTSNYTVCGFGNINYTGSPTQPLEMYYCNSSYRTVSEEMPNYGASDATANMTGNVLLMHLNDNVSGVYNASLSDNFNAGSLDAKWTILRENSGMWSASGTTLNITTNGDDFYMTTNTAPLFWQSIDSSQNYEVTVDVTATPDTDYEQGGIFFYEDDDSYMRLTYAYVGGVGCYLTREVSGTCTNEASSSCPDGGVTLKLRKIGDRYLAYYSTDGGATYTYVGSTTASITASKIGLSAFNHAGELFVFDNFNVYELPASAGVVEDSSGVGSNGTKCGTTVVAGKFNGAFEFDGLTDFVDCGDDASLPQTTPFTVSTWVKLKRLNQGWKVVTNTYIDISHVTLSIFFSDDNRFSFTTANGTWNPTGDLKTGAVSANQWYHVVAVWNGTTKLIYLDGDLSNSTNPADNYRPGGGTGNFSLGARLSDPHYCLDGVIDEVAIWNRSLNATEIKDLYTRAVHKPVDSPFCVWGHSFNTTELDNIEYSSRNSSYTKISFSVNNSKIGDIDTTDTCYYYFGSEATGASGYLIRYANGSSGTNVSFADSNVAWSSANDVVNWTQTQFTPDLWHATIKEGDLFQLGVYVENNTGANYTNFTLYEDEIGDVNWNISDPHIAYYQSASSGKDYDKNGTYAANMTIHVEMATDPDGPGTVTHNLTLRYPDGSWYYTINLWRQNKVGFLGY
jgi:hypothetical protein